MLSSKKDINQQLHDTIYKKVTKKTHNHESPKKNGDGTIKKCIEFFKKEADPNVLSELEKSLSKQIKLEKLPEKKEEYQKHYKYYIENFLPALKDEVIKSEELAVSTVFGNGIEQSQRPQTKRGKIVKTILDITNRSNNKDHSSSTIQNQKGRRNSQKDRQDNALGLLKSKSFSSEVAVTESSGSNALERDSLAKGVSGKGTPGTYKILRNSGHNSALTVPPLGQVRTLEASKETSLNPITQSQLNGSFSQSDLSIDCKDLKNEKPSTTVDAVEVPSSASTSKLSNNNDSDSGVSLGELSKESLKSPVSSRRSSMRSILSSAGEGNDPVLSEQIAEKKPQVQENENSDGQEGKIPSQVKGELKSNDKEPELALLEEQKKEAVLSKQEASNKENNSEVKQPNNRNLHVALVAGCALSTIGCIVAGAMTSGLVGAGLFAMAAVFAIAAVAELHSNFLSSKLTSINVSPLVDDKELTAL